MSWDIFICNFVQDYASFDEIKDGGPRFPLGALDSVQAAISAIFVGTDWSEPGEGYYEGPFCAVTFQASDGGPVDCLMLFGRAGEEIVPLIVELCVRNGWQGMDTSAGTFLEKSPTPEAGLRQWMTYRSQVLGLN